MRRASCHSGIWDLASDGLGAFQSMGSFPGHLIQGAWGLGNFTSYTVGGVYVQYRLALGIHTAPS